MKFLTRTIIVLVAFNLTTRNVGLAQNQPEQETVTISGSAVLPGVTMMGLPGNPVTGSGGIYSVTVPSGWSGRVVPTKEGYKFVPASKVYSAVTSDLTNEKYLAEIVKVIISGNAGVEGVEMKGLPVNTLADQNGNYQATVDYGWTGTVTPLREGYAFKPTSVPYAKVMSDQASQDYEAKVMKFTISGSAGVPGVEMKGLPGNVFTDERGYYSATVPYGFAGTVMPTKEGYTFDPVMGRYPKVVKNYPNGNFAAKPVMLTISGQIVIRGVPVEGVLFSADNGGGSDTTGTEGKYNLKVPYGWSGKITPFKYGMHFNPPSMTFTNVTTNTVDGESEQPKGEGVDPYRDFGDSRSRRSRGSGSDLDPPWNLPGSRSRARSRSAFEPAVRSGNRRVLVIPAGEVKAKELAETTEDMHVMSHILDEGFKKTRRIQGFFTDFGAFFGRDSRNTEATHLQGFGVLFLMEVNFAFSPPPGKQAQDPTETTEAVDSTWQKARRQVFSPRTSPGMGEEGSANDYGNQMVEELKRELVKALKHAGNIRNIKPDEWIILTVIGGQRQFGMGGMMGSGMGGMMSGGMGGMMSGGTGGMMSGGTGGMMSGGMGAGMGGGGSFSGFVTTASSPSTVLTIRAKKSDVDGFAKGVFDFEQFQEKVEILTY